jgi:hypothetical protein
MLLVNVGGTGRNALTLGAIAYTRGSHLDADGNVNDDLAQHEAYRSRQIVAFGDILGRQDHDPEPPVP